MALLDSINDPQKKETLVADCVQLVESQVAAKGGISGLGLKAAYASINSLKPGYVAGAIERLLPEVLDALDPIWSEAVQTGNAIEFITNHRDRTADMLLGITDARIETSSNNVLRGAYSKLRNSAKSDVEEAVPGLAQIIHNYAKG
ncbi:MAG: hypothetical protein VKJ24_01080 [Synechococcales bacterium]|nr:hypothetical protein [Synechococcales bacterium]